MRRKGEKTGEKKEAGKEKGEDKKSERKVKRDDQWKRYLVWDIERAGYRC